jgi:hypothetical protein
MNKTETGVSTISLFGTKGPGPERYSSRRHGTNESSVEYV